MPVPLPCSRFLQQRGIRVPLLARRPGRIAPGRVSAHPCRPGISPGPERRRRQSARCGAGGQKGRQAVSYLQKLT